MKSAKKPAKRKIAVKRKKTIRPLTEKELSQADLDGVAGGVLMPLGASNLMPMPLGQGNLMPMPLGESLGRLRRR